MNTILICDFFEVTILTVFFYYCFVWLDYNKQKSLLKPIVMIITLNALAWICELKALQILFFYITTPGSIIYYLLYEKSLQKNYSALQSIRKTFDSKNTALIQKNIEMIIQEAIHGLYEQKNIIYILEQSDPLNNFVVPSLHLNTLLSKEIIKFFIKSTTQFKNCSFLIKNTEIIGSTITIFDDLIITSDQREIQELLEPLADTDAIIIVGLYKTNQWTIFHKEHGYFSLTTKELFKIIYYILSIGDGNNHDYTKNSTHNPLQHSL